MNELQHEKSPYLRQHQNNPVAWLPWGEKAFERAKSENKPIFLSIGYSTCHWCHVMARECFESPEVAEVLNSGFVAIKVDREEHPAVDALYMSALLALTGTGGWPLSAWLTSDGRPFFAGTYFPRPQFLALTKKIAQLWSDEQPRLLEDAATFYSAIKTNLQSTPPGTVPLSGLLPFFEIQYEQRFDERNGGMKGAPKFPQSMGLMAMMRADLLRGPTRAREFVGRTLDHMTSAGLYDHVEGGFHRYCVDEEWAVPHFEKMLYDQAWISMALLEAAQFLHNSEYLKTAKQTLRWVQEQMTHPEGGFYSALDAESVDPATGRKQEGFYYTFLKSDLPMEYASVCPVVEGRVLPHRPPENVDVDFAKLLQIRKTHPLPHRDEKIIASWNGWMISAFCKAYDVTGEETWKHSAEKAWMFLQNNLRSKTGLARRWSDGDTSIPGTSEDYAGVIHAALSLYQSTLDENYLREALALQNEMNERFWDEDSGGFYLADNGDPHLLFRFHQESDGVTPGSNSQAADNLIRLSFLTDQSNFSEQAQRILERHSTRFAESPLNYPYLGVALADLHGLRKIVVVRPNKELTKLRKALADTYHPFAMLAGAGDVIASPDPTDGSTERFFICTRESCLPAVHLANEVVGLLK